jgi:hypothetical protein
VGVGFNVALYGQFADVRMICLAVGTDSPLQMISKQAGSRINSTYPLNRSHDICSKGHCRKAEGGGSGRGLSSKVLSR